jgi:hypothetical protein
MPPATSDSAALERLPSDIRVHVVGAGPVGLLLTALLQSLEGVSVRLYEKRREYTRTRMVTIAPYLVADSVESYGADAIDGDSVGAIFDPPELEQGIAFRQSMPSDLSAMLKSWALGFVITFLYGQRYDCDEYCKYAKNIENPHYKFIPMIHRTHYDGSVSHVTGVINISAQEYEAMPSRFDGEWLRGNFPEVAQSMDRFIAKIKEETHGEILDDLEIGYHWICTARATRPVDSSSRPGRATILSPPHRCSSPATRPSARRTFSRFRSASSAQCFSRG